MLAELGYVAYAPDYFGEQARSLDHAYALMRPFADDRGLFHRHGLAALDVLSAEGGADRSRLGAIGFCWGGFAALELACKADLRCVVGFHPGLSLGPLSAASDVRASVLVCVGDRDPYVPMPDIVRFLDEMHDAAVDCQVHIHSGAPHSFTNPEEYAYETGEAHVGYDARPDGRSWLAMRQLLAEKLPA
jgi:dienelactone hydrolase